MALEIIYVFQLCSQQPVRFHRFMTAMLSDLDRTGTTESFLGSHSVVEAFHNYCMNNFSMDGKWPLCLRRLCLRLRTLWKILKTSSGYVHSDSGYQRILNECRDVGLNDTGVQLLIMACASLELFLPRVYLRYYCSGTPQQLQNLKQPPFELKRKEQVSQLRRSLLLKRPDLLPMQADAMISVLSDNNNVTARQDLVFHNHSPYCASLGHDGRICMERLSAQTLSTEIAPKVYFNYGQDDSNHYVPTWCSDIQKANGWVMLTSRRKNHDRSTYVPKTAHTMKEDVLVDWATEIMDYGQNHSWLDKYPFLLESGHYHVVADLEGEVVDYLKCDLDELQNAIIYTDTGDGVKASLNLYQLSLPSPVIGTGSMVHLPYHRLPQFMLSKLIQGEYATKFWAKKSVYIHLLMNCQVEGKGHWAMQHIHGHHDKGFLLLVPECLGSSFCFAAAFIFFDPVNFEGVHASFLDQNGFSADSFLIGRLDEIINEV